MSISWVEAVKEFAKRNGNQFIIPKRGSADYDKVKKLQMEMSQAKAMPVETPAEKTRKRRAPKELAVAQVESKVEPEAKPIMKKVPAKVGISAPAVPIVEEVKDAVPIVKKTRAKKVMPMATPEVVEEKVEATPLPTPAKRIRKKPALAVVTPTIPAEQMAITHSKKARKVKPQLAVTEDMKKMEKAKETVRRKRESKLMIDNTKTVMTF
jgi:hypothetical protein